MNDTYVELLIRKKHSILPVLLRNLLIVAGVLALLAAFLLTGSIVLFLAGAILLGLAYLVNFNKIIEYEYLFLDKHLTIDRIQNQSRRKTVAEYDPRYFPGLTKRFKFDKLAHKKKLTRDHGGKEKWHRLLVTALHLTMFF